MPNHQASPGKSEACPVNNSHSGIVLDGSLGTGTLNATVADSVAVNNSSAGFDVRSTPGHAAVNLILLRSMAANNVLGISASGPTTVRVGESAITGNQVSAGAIAGAVLRSYGDNNIDGNGDGDPAPNPIAKK